MELQLPARLREARERVGLTREELAAELKLQGPQAVKEWEYGTKVPQLKRLSEVARALGVSQGYLLGDPDAQEPGLARIERKLDQLLHLVAQLVPHAPPPSSMASHVAPPGPNSINLDEFLADLLASLRPNQPATPAQLRHAGQQLEQARRRLGISLETLARHVKTSSGREWTKAGVQKVLDGRDAQRFVEHVARALGIVIGESGPRWEPPDYARLKAAERDRWDGPEELARLGALK